MEGISLLNMDALVVLSIRCKGGAIMPDDSRSDDVVGGSGREKATRPGGKV